MTHTCTYRLTADSKDALVIEFDYQPGEEMTRDYPGCEADVEITAIYANGMDMIYWMEEHMDFFREKCFEYIAYEQENAELDRGEERYLERLECV
jgi:hypothetical protein